uniref:Uncharacterized protein n=1 Tax=Solanum lycopersicum TaxID=4081 RepID=A0A3Q7J9D7_SOLLC
MSKKRVDSLESLSMILESDNIECWEVSNEDQDEWTINLSWLFIGNKFMVRIPTHKEETRARLEQQFKAESNNKHMDLNFWAINYSAEVYQNGNKEVLLNVALVYPPYHPGHIPPKGGQGGEHE